MTNHLSEDELILHYYGETDRADEARIESHLSSCAECQFANHQLRRVMTLVDTAASVEAPLGFERTAWAGLEPQYNQLQRSRRWCCWIPQFALAGAVAPQVMIAFMAGRFTGREPAGVTPASPVAAASPERVLHAAFGDHLDRTQMMLMELANAES